jgi:hypothetical protein
VKIRTNCTVAKGAAGSGRSKKLLVKISDQIFELSCIKIYKFNKLKYLKARRIKNFQHVYFGQEIRILGPYLVFLKGI